MHNRKSGFTLMEIMVVIIVIAVLASVAGPMIGSITDQGRTSATKSKLSSLKSAMLAYQSDVGRLPFEGKPGCSTSAKAYCADTVLNYECSEKNVLTSENWGAVPEMNFAISNYSRKWKGPYMDSEPSDFMYDSWGNPIYYVADGNNVYLWSYGPDQTDDGGDGKISSALTQQKENADLCDDIITSVARVRKKFK